MLKTPRGQVGQFLSVNFTIPILVADGYCSWTLDIDPKSRKAQATLLDGNDLLALRDDLWIIVEGGHYTNIHGEYAIEKAHLIGREANPIIRQH